MDQLDVKLLISVVVVSNSSARANREAMREERGRIAGQDAAAVRQIVRTSDSSNPLTKSGTKDAIAVAGEQVSREKSAALWCG